MFELKNKKLTFGIYATRFITNSIDSYGVDLNYVKYFQKWGDVELITGLIPVEKWMDRIDILVVPGGLDVDPRRYGEKPMSNTSNPNIDFEILDASLLQEWMINQRKPVIAICRGFQSVNVALGGSLYQHITEHVQRKSGDSAEQPLFTNIPNAKKIFVNSFHHQSLKEVAPELDIIGWTPLYNKTAKRFGDKWLHYNFFWELDKNTNKYEKSKQEYFVVPELFVGRTQPILGCQFHPEKNDCSFFATLVDKFIKDNFNIEENVIANNIKETAK